MNTAIYSQVYSRGSDPTQNRMHPDCAVY